MEFKEPMNESKNDLSSPISKGSELDSDGLPSLVDEDIQLKARISTIESKLNDIADLVKQSLPKKKLQKQGPRQSGERSRLIYGEDFEQYQDSDGYEIPDLEEDSNSDEDGEDPEGLEKKSSKRSNVKMRESIMYGRNKQDRDQLRDAHLRATSGSSIVVPQKFSHEIIDTTSFIKYKDLVREIDEHEANPHNLPVFPFRCYSSKAKQKIVNSLKTYHGNPRNKRYDPTMTKLAPTDRELTLMLTSEFCVSFERMMRPSDQQH